MHFVLLEQLFYILKSLEYRKQGSLWKLFCFLNKLLYFIYPNIWCFVVKIPPGVWAFFGYIFGEKCNGHICCFFKNVRRSKSTRHGVSLNSCFILPFIQTLPLTGAALNTFGLFKNAVATYRERLYAGKVFVEGVTVKKYKMWCVPNLHYSHEMGDQW